MRDEPDESPGPQTTSSSGLATTPSGNIRRERGAIAAQACDTCRSRKQRCDEQRPKCGTCLRFKLECKYREPQPTKKDRTLLEILDRIKSMEGKLDSLNERAGFNTTSLTSGHSPMPSLVAISGPMSMPSSSGFQFANSSRSTSTSDDHQYAYASSTQQLLTWPVFQQLLDVIQDKVPGLDPSKVEGDIPTIVLGIHERWPQTPLAIDGSLGQLKATGSTPPLRPGGIPLAISDLSWDTMQQLSKAYFDSLNFVFPFLDRHTFLSEILPSIMRVGINESVTSTLALMVFALGEMVVCGSFGPPIRSYESGSSGIKGGTSKEPPGLVLFNEARRRMGFHVAECNLENIQLYALAGLYYGTCSHNLELWQMTTCASRAVELLVRCRRSELSSPRGDVIKRIYWHCSMMETCMHLELGLPLSGLENVEKDVGMPIFSGHFNQEDYIGNQQTHFQQHFASQIVMRRLMSDFHKTLSQDTSPSSVGPLSNRSGSLTPASNVNPANIKHLAHQLDQWRGMLPEALRWHEDLPGAFPNSTTGVEVYNEPRTFPGISQLINQPLSPRTVLPTPAPSSAPSTGSQQQPLSPTLMFTTDLDAPPTEYPYALDVQIALLRSRYYQTKYMLHRPFLYKALHYPDAMTADDAAGVATCLRAALKWPVTMSPTCKKKRVIPCLFIWTQNILGILLVLHLARKSPMLQRIVHSGLCGETWEMEASESMGLYIDWLRDLKEVDSAAGYAWLLVRAVYELE